MVLRPGRPRGPEKGAWGRYGGRSAATGGPGHPRSGLSQPPKLEAWRGQLGQNSPLLKQVQAGRCGGQRPRQLRQGGPERSRGGSGPSVLAPFPANDAQGSFDPGSLAQHHGGGQPLSRESAPLHFCCLIKVDPPSPPLPCATS